MGSRSQDFGGISWTTVLLFCFVVVVVFFYKVFCNKLKLCNDRARKLNRVSRDWSVIVSAASDLFNLMHKDLIKLIRKTPRESIEGSIASPNLPM